MYVCIYTHKCIHTNIHTSNTHTDLLCAAIEFQPDNTSKTKLYIHKHIHTYTHAHQTHTDLQCAAIEFQPDDTSKTRLEQGDRGKCRIQRRRDGAVKIASNPGTHVWLKVVDPPPYDVLPLHVRVVDMYMRFPSQCAAEGSVCTNTNGSHVCACKTGFVGSGLFCVREGASGSFLNGSKYQACPGRML
jgi:hypothetical protein